MYKLLFLLIVLTLGCAPAKQNVQPKIFPPIFAIGDIVSVIDSPGNECGYIISLSYNNDCANWKYYIMFQNQQMYYLENEITLVKRAIWYDENKKIEVAETANEKYFNVLEETK
jgi:hypothetical protein